MGYLTPYLSYSHEMEGPLDQPIYTTAVECERHNAE